MISNFDIEDIASHYHFNVIIAMKDELKNMKPINANYVINLESSNIGNGSHWMGLKIEEANCIYCDSYGYLPPEEIISFCKRINGSHLAYNTKQIQDLSAKTCGFFAIGFLIYLHINASDSLYKRSHCFSHLFSLDTKLNNKKLQQFFRLLPNNDSLPILKKLYSQK